MKKRNKLLIMAVAVFALLVIAGIAGWKWHEQPSFCSAVCHKVMAPYVESWQDSDLLARSHAEADIYCLDCHEPTLSEQMTEAKKYVTGDYRTPLESATFPSSFCLECHGSYDELAEKTADYEYEGVAVNPHAQLVDQTVASGVNPHGTSNSTRIECSSCHTMHDDSPGIVYCFGCHHSGTFKTCAECHGDE